MAVSDSDHQTAGVAVAVEESHLPAIVDIPRSLLPTRRGRVESGQQRNDTGEIRCIQVVAIEDEPDFGGDIEGHPARAASHERCEEPFPREPGPPRQIGERGGSEGAQVSGREAGKRLVAILNRYSGRTQPVVDRLPCPCAGGEVTPGGTSPSDPTFGCQQLEDARGDAHRLRIRRTR